MGIPLEHDGMNLAVLEEELRRGPPVLMYVTTDFNNPTGITTNLEKRMQLAELSQEHGFWIAGDAPYRPLRYEGDEVLSIPSLTPYRVLHMSSYSKLVALGLRLGYLAAPASVIARLAMWDVDTHIGLVLPTEGMV